MTPLGRFSNFTPASQRKACLLPHTGVQALCRLAGPGKWLFFYLVPGTVCPPFLAALLALPSGRNLICGLEFFLLLDGFRTFPLGSQDSLSNFCFPISFTHQFISPSGSLGCWFAALKAQPATGMEAGTSCGPQQPPTPACLLPVSTPHGPQTWALAGAF